MPTPGEKAVRLLLILIASPYTFTRKQLEIKLGSNSKKTTVFDTAKRTLESAGLLIDYEPKHYRYAVIPTTGFKELTYLSPLSEDDKRTIKNILSQQLRGNKADHLFSKLDSLYNFQSLGLEALRRPEIEKIDQLQRAIKEKRQVILVRYRSRSSNSEKDRTVEPFSLSTENGMLKAWDIERSRTSHFKLSRLERVRVTDIGWQFEQKHQLNPADIFDIVDPRQVNVDLVLNVSAYNDLVERHPAARTFTRPGAKENTYDLQAPINVNFIGLLPYLLANWRGVEVLGPSELKERLAKETEGIRRWLTG